MKRNPSRKTFANQQPAAVTPDAERGSEATGRQSPDRSAAALEPCSDVVWSAAPTRAGWWAVRAPDGDTGTLYVKMLNDGRAALFNNEDSAFGMFHVPSEEKWAGPFESRDAAARNLEVPAPSEGGCAASRPKAGSSAPAAGCPTAHERS